MSASQGKRTTSPTDATIAITVLFHSDHSQRHFSVSPQLRVGDFLEQLLQELAQGEQAERVKRLRECYEPVLELLRDGEGIELDKTESLIGAGVGDHAVCQIAARPIKEKMMFCRYTSQG